MRQDSMCLCMLHSMAERDCPRADLSVAYRTPVVGDVVMERNQTILISGNVLHGDEQAPIDMLNLMGLHNELMPAQLHPQHCLSFELSLDRLI
jgi:hypothetical protein